jgi:hypothetical protein
MACITVEPWKAAERAEKRNPAMASESRPSHQPAAPHATAADLVLEALTVLWQPGSALVRPRPPFGVGGAVSEPKFPGSPSCTMGQRPAVKPMSGTEALHPAVERLMRLGRTARRQVLGKTALWQVLGKQVLGLTRTPWRRKASLLLHEYQ